MNIQIRSIDPEQLLANAGWLRALARGLVDDPHRAEDAFQETLLTALASPPAAMQDERSLRAWLARVLRNHVLSFARKGRRALERERRTARPEALPAAGDPLEKLEIEAALVEAIRALEPEDREVVVLRYFEGLPSAAIAGRTGTTDSAVRSRLLRALEKLRARLDRRFGGNRRIWAAALVDLARSRAGAAPAAASSAAATMGAIALALAGGIAAAVVAFRGSTAPPGSPAGSELAATAGPMADTPTEPVAVSSSDPERERSDRRSSAASESAATGGTEAVAAGSFLRVTARTVDEKGRPLAGVRMRVVDVVGEPAAESDAEGKFELTLGRPLQKTSGSQLAFEILASGPGRAQRTIRVDFEFDSEESRRRIDPGQLEATKALGDLLLLAGGAIEGRVLDAQGRPVAGAYVYPATASPRGGPSEEEERAVFGGVGRTFGVECWAEAETGRDGAYRIEGVPAMGVSVYAKAVWSLHARTDLLNVLAGATVRAPDLVLVQPQSENLVTGRVLGPREEPIAGASIELRQLGALANMDPIAHGSTASEGRFEILVPGGMQFRLDCEYELDRYASAHLASVASGDRDILLRFSEPRWIDVFAVGPALQPIPGISVNTFDPQQFGLRHDSKPVADGHVKLRLPSQPFHVGVWASGFKASPQGPFDPATCPDRLTFEMHPTTMILGRVTADGRPVQGARVHAHATLDSDGLRNGDRLRKSDDGFFALIDPQIRGLAVTDEQGSFRLQPYGGEKLHLHADADGFARGALGPIELHAGRSIEGVEIALVGGGRIEGSVLTAPGVDPQGMVVGVSQGDGHATTARVGADGAFRFEHLAAGSWQVLRCDPSLLRRLESGTFLHARPGETPRWDVDLADGRTERFDLDLRKEVPCAVSGSLLFDGAPPAGWTATLYKTSWGGDRRPVGSDGTFQLRSREPGDHTLALFGAYRRGSSMRITAKVELAPTANEFRFDLATGSIDFENVPATRTSARPEEPEPLAGLMWENGEGVHWRAGLHDSEGGRIHLENVPAGRLQVRLRPESPQTESIESWPVSFEVDLRAGERKVLRLPE